MSESDVWRQLEEAAAASSTVSRGVIGGGGTLTRRLYPESLHDLLAALDPLTGQRSLVYRWAPGTGASPPAALSTHGIELANRDYVPPAASSDPTAGAKNGSGPVSTVLTLLDPATADVFTALVSDVASAVADAPDTPAGLRVFGDRVRQWQALLAGIGAKGLSPDRRRGLVGELLTWLDLLVPPIGAESAAAAWTGPSRANQDFQTARCAVEVKTTTAQQPTGFTVANERELDATGTDHLVVVHYALDERLGGSGSSLAELAARVQGVAAAASWRAGALMRDGLVRSGYLNSQVHLYDQPRYSVRQRHLYKVGDGFPCIVEGDLRPGVGAVTYRVSLSACTSHEVDGDWLESRLTGSEPPEASDG